MISPKYDTLIFFDTKSIKIQNIIKILLKALSGFLSKIWVNYKSIIGAFLYFLQHCILVTTISIIRFYLYNTLSC